MWLFADQLLWGWKKKRWLHILLIQFFPLSLPNSVASQKAKNVLWWVSTTWQYENSGTLCSGGSYFGVQSPSYPYVAVESFISLTSDASGSSRKIMMLEKKQIVLLELLNSYTRRKVSTELRLAKSGTWIHSVISYSFDILEVKRHVLHPSMYAKAYSRVKYILSLNDIWELRTGHFRTGIDTRKIEICGIAY